METDIGIDLPAKKEEAIIELLNQPTVRKAAEVLGLSEKTLHRWLDETEFAAAYRKARRMAFAHAVQMTQRYAPVAISTLARIANDNAAPPAARVSAATALLRFSRDSIELDDLAQRIETLEASLPKATQ